jgi:Rrf2 family protein
MKLSRESQYGLEGLAYLASQENGTILNVAEIAEQADLPKAFLAKIFRKLANYGILKSFRGKERGFRLTRSSKEVNVKEIIEAIEGPDFFKRCIFWSGHCSEQNPCELHDVWKNVKPMATKQLEALTLEKMIRGNGAVNLK